MSRGTVVVAVVDGGCETELKFSQLFHIVAAVATTTAVSLSFTSNSCKY